MCSDGAETNVIDELLAWLFLQYYSQVFDVESGLEFLGYQSSDLWLCYVLVYAFAVIFYFGALFLLLSRRFFHWAKRIMRQRGSTGEARPIYKLYVRESMQQTPWLPST